MKFLSSFKKRFIEFMPSRKEVGKVLWWMIVFALVSYHFGFWFGKGLSQTYHPIVINTVESE